MVGLKPSGYIIAILVFTFFLVGGITMIMEFKSVDPTFASEPEFNSFNNTFNVYDDIITQVNQTQGFTDSAPQFGAFGALNALVESGWQTLRLLGTSYSFMNDVFNGLHTVFGVPAFIGPLIIAAVAIVIVFAILGAIFRTDI